MKIRTVPRFGLVLIALTVSAPLVAAPSTGQAQVVGADASRVYGREASVDGALGATLQRADGQRLFRDRFQIPVSPKYPAIVVCEAGSGLLSGQSLAAFVSDRGVTHRNVRLEGARLENGFPELSFEVQGTASGVPVTVAVTVRIEPQHWVACMTDRDLRFAQAFHAAEARFFSSMTWNKPSPTGSEQALRLARGRAGSSEAQRPSGALGFEFRRVAPGATPGTRRFQYLRASPTPGSDFDGWTPVMREELIDSAGRLLEVRERRGQEPAAELVWGKPNRHGQCTALTDGLEIVRPCLPGRPVATTTATEAKLKRAIASGGPFRFEQVEYRPAVDRAAPVAVTYAHSTEAGPGVVSIRAANQPAVTVTMDSSGEVLEEPAAPGVRVEWRFAQ